MNEAVVVAKNDKEYPYREPNARTIVITMVLAFVLPVIIMALALMKIQVWPGGKFTLYVYDLKAQFAPVISSLRYIGKSDHSLLYSFYGALGNNAFLNYIGYIFDPTVWITVLFPLEQMPNVIYFITLFKIGLCGVGLCVFFFFGIKERKYPFIILVLSVCYALMSYNIMYSQCIMWFNVIALAPVILLGIEKIIDGKKGGIYILCMTISLIYNAQLAYMIGIFSILYLIYRLSEINEKRSVILFRFIICNIICAGLYMPIALPIMYNIINARLKTFNSMAGTLFYYPVWKVAKQFLSCQYSTIESGGFPNLFCGTFIPLIALLALILPLKSLRTRVILTGIYVFFMASFCTVPLNQFWHGFNEPNSFPARYSFLFCLYLIILVYCVICYALEKKNISRLILYCSYGMALVITCAEMYLNAGFILTSFNVENDYNINSAYQLQLRDMKDVLNNIEDNDFYRIGRDVPYSLNDGMIYGYNGIGYFSSMFERRTMDFLGDLGYSQKEHALGEAGGTPLVESLLGVRYKILSFPQLFGYYKSIYNNNSFNLQYNENALPLGFLVKYRQFNPDNDSELSAGLSDHNSFVFQEYILSEILGERVQVYEKVDYSLEEVDSNDYARYVKIKFTATSDKPVWIYCKGEHEGISVATHNKGTSISSDGISTNENDDETDGSLLKVNGKSLFPFVNNLSTLCIYLGTFKEGEEVEVEAACSCEFDDPWIVYYNANECEQALKTIKKTGFVVTEHRNGVIRGKINIRDENDIMIVTLPYMKGYHIKVDGKRNEYGYYRESFVTVRMEPGEHIVEISFVPYGLISGSVIGLIFLVITVLYLATKKRRNLNDSIQASEVHE